MAEALYSDIKSLYKKIGELPEHAKLYFYVGADGTKLQAEWPQTETQEGGWMILVSSSTCVPQAGGIAVVNDVSRPVVYKRAEMSEDRIIELLAGKQEHIDNILGKTVRAVPDADQ